MSFLIFVKLNSEEILERFKMKRTKTRSIITEEKSNDLSEVNTQTKADKSKRSNSTVIPASPTRKSRRLCGEDAEFTAYQLDEV